MAHVNCAIGTDFDVVILPMGHVVYQFCCVLHEFLFCRQVVFGYCTALTGNRLRKRLLKFCNILSGWWKQFLLNRSVCTNIEFQFSEIPGMGLLKYTSASLCGR